MHLLYGKSATSKEAIKKSPKIVQLLAYRVPHIFIFGCAYKILSSV